MWDWDRADADGTANPSLLALSVPREGKATKEAGSTLTRAETLHDRPSRGVGSATREVVGVGGEGRDVEDAVIGWRIVF